MPTTSKVVRFRHLLGKLTDTEIARRAGVSQGAVSSMRARLGIPPVPRAVPDLDAIGPDETLRRIRAYRASGRPMRASEAYEPLQALARRHFGGWYQAVEAAGIKPEGKPRAPGPKVKRRLKLTEGLLRGPKTALELEDLTGIRRSAINYQRRKLGIVRREKVRGPWAAKAIPMLGNLSDAEIARRVGVSGTSVALLRDERGIAGIPTTRARTKVPKSGAAAILADLTPKQRVVLVGRFMTDPPRSLAEIGRELGITKQAVAGIEGRLAARIP